MKSHIINKHTQKEKTLRKEFVNILLKTPVKNIKFKGNRIALEFFGHRIADKISVRLDYHVGNWSRKKKEIFIDRNISTKDRRKSFEALCVHEVVEKFLTEKFGLNTDNESHVVAQQKTKEYIKNSGGNWLSHEMIVYWDWHNHGEH